MILHIYRRLGKHIAKLHIVPLHIKIIFKVDKLRFLVGISISNSQKLIEWIYRKVEEYRKPEKLCEPTQHNEDLYNLHTRVAYKFYSISHIVSTKGPWNIFRNMEQGTKVSYCKGIHTQSVFLSLWSHVRNQYQKIFERNPHIFTCNMHVLWYLKNGLPRWR